MNKQERQAHRRRVNEFRQRLHKAKLAFNLKRIKGMPLFYDVNNCFKQ